MIGASRRFRSSPTKEIELQVVTIISERPLINKSATNAVRIMTNEDMLSAPVRGLDQLLALQAGVILQDGNLHIRGGRVDETGFYLEGVSITDPQYGGRGLTLVQDALEEVSIQSAGYEAEFGRANAGIIQHQLRGGGSVWKGTLEYVTDNVGFQGKDKAFSGTKRFGAYWYGYNEMTATAGGPVFDERFRFFGMFNYNYQRDKHPQPYTGIDVGPVKDPSSGDSVNFVYPAGTLVNNSGQRYAFVGTITMDFKPLLLKLSGSYARTRDSYSLGSIQTIRSPSRGLAGYSRTWEELKRHMI